SSSPTSTDAVLQKCRVTLEAQAQEIDKERKEKLAIQKERHELESALEHEKSLHHLTQTRLHDFERRDRSEKDHFRQQVQQLEEKLTNARRE
ncbi:unnamed protein product, partial [Amoebophrya sp. A25]